MAFPSSLNAFLSWAAFGFVSLAVIVAPWLFGAWEMWWFWPFAFCVFAATFLFSLRLMCRALTQDQPRDAEQTASRYGVRLRGMLTLSFFPFLIYALARATQADVPMDAERSFLLHFTAFLLGVQIVFGFNRAQLRWLFLLILFDLCCLGAYGIGNHFIAENARVLWMEGEPQYQKGFYRATGSYYCPDHFSGIMELAVCLGLGLALARDQRRPWKIWAGALIAIGVTGVILSKSRGGGLTLIVLMAAVLLWGFSQWPPLIRWRWRLGVGLSCVLAIVLLCFCGGAYVKRFQDYLAWEKLRPLAFREAKAHVARRFHASSRGKMIGGAWRAWKTNPVLGIGPGMHQNVWPHFAATPDGDRRRGIEPTLLNNEFHSYEVHSDWVQLLEEYGLVGLALFLLPAYAVFGILLRGHRREEKERRMRSWTATDRRHHAVVLAGILACVCMGFHSLGDFNLQMPATVWLFTAIIAIPLAHVLSETRRKIRESREVVSLIPFKEKKQ